MAKPSRPTSPALSELLAFGHELADAAGAAILPHFRKRLVVHNKAAAKPLPKGAETGDAGYDPVTVADRAAERAIIKLVRQRYPDHGIEGEEFGSQQAEAAWRWVIDPIDGTRSFVLGMPTWGTLIGLYRAGEPVLGLMDQPYTRERFWSTGKSAMFRGADGVQRRLKSRACAGLEQAMMMTTHPELFAAGAEARGFQRVKSQVRSCRYGGDCYSYCLLAAGHVDVIVEAGLKPYDVAALIPIVAQAGGCITTWDGGSPAGGGRIVACGDPTLHEQVLPLLR